MSKKVLGSPIYITATEVLELVRKGTATVVVDVREDDHAGGHIKGSVHVPAPTFRSNPGKYLQLAEGKDNVVFHCMFSQYRGPSSANAFIDAWNKRAVTDPKYTGLSPPEVYIMAGGFNAVAKLALKGDIDVVDDFQKEYHA